MALILHKDWVELSRVAPRIDSRHYGFWISRTGLRWSPVLCTKSAYLGMLVCSTCFEAHEKPLVVYAGYLYVALRYCTDAITSSVGQFFRQLLRQSHPEEGNLHCGLTGQL